jgi:hypothetical protein
MDFPCWIPHSITEEKIRDLLQFSPRKKEQCSIISKETKSAEPNRVAPLLPNSDKAEKLGEIEEQPNGVH